MNEDDVQEFLGRAIEDIAGLTTCVLAGIGDRVGLFKAMAGGGAVTAEELAARAGTNARYTHEWLAAMAGSGYVTYDPATASFVLPAEHGVVLANEGGQVFLGGMLQMLLGALPVIDELTECFRDGGGVPQSAYPQGRWDGMERFSATYFENLLVSQWLPALPDVEAALIAGAEVADVGSGAGKGLIVLAGAFPCSRFVGYARHAPNVEHANRRAVEAGVGDRVRFEVLDATKGLPQTFDVIFTFDVIHDAIDPVSLLQAIHRALRPSGRYVCLDINCSQRLEENGGPLGAFFYGISVLYYMTTSLAGGGVGLGTAGLPPRKLEELATLAGFRSIRQAQIANPFNNLYELQK